MLVLSGTLTPVDPIFFLCFLINHPPGLRHPGSLGSHESGSKTFKAPCAFGVG